MAASASIAVLNRSTLVTGAEVVAAAAAINKQVARDFAPMWGTPGTLQIGDPPAGAWRFTLADTIDQANDLGYHTLADGTVSAIIDVAACRNIGDDWRQCLSHEVLEALADPNCNRMGEGAAASFMCEVCDPVEGDSYLIDGVPVSNFVTPAYFGFYLSGKYDWLNRLGGPAPFLRPGGYIEELQNGRTWVPHTGEKAIGYMATRPNGRRAWRQGAQR